MNVADHYAPRHQLGKVFFVLIAFGSAAIADFAGLDTVRGLATLRKLNERGEAP